MVAIGAIWFLGWVIATPICMVTTFMSMNKEYKAWACVPLGLILGPLAALSWPIYVGAWLLEKADEGLQKAEKDTL